MLAPSQHTDAIPVEDAKRPELTLTYLATGPKGAQQAIELSQHADTTGVSNESRLSSELLAILSLVTSHGSEELRREYQRRGNIHRDWNLARISSAERHDQQCVHSLYYSGLCPLGAVPGDYP